MVPRPRATEDSDDDILVLDEAPAHLRIVTNEHAPIVIDSDTDDDDPNDPFGLNDQMNPLFGLTNRCRSRTWERTREGTTGEGAAGPSRSRKRSRRDSMELYSRSPSPPRKHARTGNAAAGSSRYAAFVLSDSDEGPAGPTANPAKTSDPILPKADYLVPVVQEIIPDVDPVWATARLTELMGTLKERPTPGQDAIDQIINEALETGEYPRIGGMPRPPKDVPEYGDPNYHRTERAGAAYAQIAMGALENAFPTVPVNYIRDVFSQAGRQLVPAYHVMYTQTKAAAKLYTELKKKRNVKGKARADDPGMEGADGAEEAFKEVQFLDEIIAKAAEREEAELAALSAKERAKADHAKRKADADATGEGVECQCCFDTEAPEDSVSCPEGHLFCHACLRQHAETKLGDHVPVISCMDGSGCQELFSDSTLARVLSDKTMALYHRLAQAKELELAGISGLESCPFCPFAIVIENPDENLFRCLNEACRQVTCRKCRRLNHIPKRCEEVAADLKLDRRHAIEEAMSEALLRKCPKCAKPYVKESGCNKIIGCGALSCYVCQKQISGYEHFKNSGHRVAGVTATCPLHDSQDDAVRVVQARDAAAQRVLAEAANAGVQLTEADVRVDAPAVRPGPGYAHAVPIHEHVRAIVQQAQVAVAQNHALRLANPPHMEVQRARREAARAEVMRVMERVRQGGHQWRQPYHQQIHQQLQELQQRLHPAPMPLPLPLPLPQLPPPPIQLQPLQPPLPYVAAYAPPPQRHPHHFAPIIPFAFPVHLPDPFQYLQPPRPLPPPPPQAPPQLAAQARVPTPPAAPIPHAPPPRRRVRRTARARRNLYDDAEFDPDEW